MSMTTLIHLLKSKKASDRCSDNPEKSLQFEAASGCLRVHSAGVIIQLSLTWVARAR